MSAGCKNNRQNDIREECGLKEKEECRRTLDAEGGIKSCFINFYLDRSLARFRKLDLAWLSGSFFSHLQRRMIGISFSLQGESNHLTQVKTLHSF